MTTFAKLGALNFVKFLQIILYSYMRIHRHLELGVGTAVTDEKFGVDMSKKVIQRQPISP